MEFSDALAFLEEQHSSIITTIGGSSRPQATIVRAGPYEGQLAFVRESLLDVYGHSSSFLRSPILRTCIPIDLGGNPV